MLFHHLGVERYTQFPISFNVAGTNIHHISLLMKMQHELSIYVSLVVVCWPSCIFISFFIAPTDQIYAQFVLESLLLVWHVMSWKFRLIFIWHIARVVTGYSYSSRIHVEWYYETDFNFPSNERWIDFWVLKQTPSNIRLVTTHPKDLTKGLWKCE